MRLQIIIDILGRELFKFVNIIALIMLFLAIFNPLTMLTGIGMLYVAFVFIFFGILMPIYTVCLFFDALINIFSGSY